MPARALSIAAIRGRLAAFAPRLPHTEEANAAVAAVLRDGPDGAELLFIERAEREGDPWSGHLAFPGGKREPRDASLLATATRETEEEVGLRLDEPSRVTRLDDVSANSSGYRVAEFVYMLDAQPTALVTNAEVAATLWMPIERLARREGAGTLPFVRGGQSVDVPCLRFEGRVLWGMTYRMVSQLLEAASFG